MAGEENGKRKVRKGKFEKELNGQRREEKLKKRRKGKGQK